MTDMSFTESENAPFLAVISKWRRLKTWQLLTVDSRQPTVSSSTTNNYGNIITTRIQCITRYG